MMPHHLRNAIHVVHIYSLTVWSAEKLCGLAKRIWDNPEMGWQEYKAASWTADYLREEGFDTELGAY